MIKRFPVCFGIVLIASNVNNAMADIDSHSLKSVTADIVSNTCKSDVSRSCFGVSEKSCKKITTNFVKQCFDNTHNNSLATQAVKKSGKTYGVILQCVFNLRYTSVVGDEKININACKELTRLNEAAKNNGESN